MNHIAIGVPVKPMVVCLSVCLCFRIKSFWFLLAVAVCFCLRHHVAVLGRSSCVVVAVLDGRSRGARFMTLIMPVDE